MSKVYCRCSSLYTSPVISKTLPAKPLGLMHMAGYTEAPWLVPLIWPWKSRLQSKSGLLNRQRIQLIIYRFVDFAMSRVRMLIHFGVTPYMVFDGDYLPSKALTEIDRAKRREDSKKIGLELHRMGKPSQAHLELQKAVDVTPEMARQLIDELKRHDVQYLVAPYEADAQMVYLEKKGIIQGIISEDSDLLVFGAKCLLTKLDQYGDCIAINRNDFTACKEISLVGWSDTEFRRMAILSGCDYLPSINKMGLKTAYRLVRKYKTIEKILRMLQFEGQYIVPPGYLESFRKAELTFLHQRVFCPDVNRLVMITDPDLGEDLKDLTCIGENVEAHIALGVARGDLNPMSKKNIIIKNLPTLTPKSSSTNLGRRPVGTPSDLKSNKSIESYYKARRTPLAELDPNSFTPSPSQQRLLDRHNGSWSSSPAPHRPSIIRSSTSLLTSGRVTLPQSEDLSARNRAASVVGLHPPKRQRLCEDPAGEELEFDCLDAAKIQTGRSRFFPSPSTEQSPSIKTTRKSDVSKPKEINVWSDNPIEHPSTRLADVSQGIEPKKTVKVAVFQGFEKENLNAVSRLEKKKEPKSVQVSRSLSSTSASTQESQLGSCSTPASSMTSLADSQAIVPNPDKASKTNSTVLKDKCSNQRVAKLCISQSSQTTKPKPVKSNVSDLFTRSPQREKCQNVLPLEKVQVIASQEARSHIDFSAFASKAGIVTEVPDVTQLATPKASNRKVRVLESPEASKAVSCGGSEDLMVPDSEDEMDEIDSTLEDNGVIPKLNLSRFAFTRQA